MRERNQKAVQPSAPRKEDASDELTALFDDGTKLSATDVKAATRGTGGQTPSGGQTTPPPTLPRQTPKPTHAPARDFNRRANSLERDALPAGLFPGSSKKIYDALYLRSRGAIVPCRTVRATKRDLAEWSGVRNRKTLDSHLRYLAACGLVIREWQLGQNDGYLFEVKLPEEAGLVDRGGQTPGPSEGSDQKTDRGSDQKLGSGGQTQIVDSTDTSGGPKTFTKTKDRSDDEPAALAEVFRQAERELTGKNSAEGDQWRELAEVIVAELKIAAARTTVSNVPAFLAEHLRRRLWKLDKKQAREQGRELPDQVVASAERKAAPTECPDCKGSGWWYPEGTEKGVAKCKHSRLGQQS